MVEIIQPGSAQDKKAIRLATRKNNWILNEQPPCLAPEQVEASIKKWKNERPCAVLRSKPNSLYNCVGMIFASRRTCIQINELPQILAEDGYRQLKSEEGEKPGDIVIYYKNGDFVHVGVILETFMNFGRKTIRVLSKWGLEGEYIHDIDCVPKVFGETKRFWTERS